MSNRLILCAGMKRSGTTWLYNVLRYCYLNAGMSVYADFDDAYQSQCAADVHVLKIHEYRKDRRQAADLVFTSIRDLRDAVASQVRRKMIPNEPQACANCAERMMLLEYQPWQQHSDYEMRYEEMIRDPVGTVQDISNRLGLQFAREAAEGVASDVEKLTRIRLARRDSVTQLWPGHITDGRAHSFGETITPESIAAIEAVAREWLREKGYL